MVTTEARVAVFAEVEHLWRLHRDKADCQIVRHSILPRGLAQPFALEVDGQLVGYAGVWIEHFPGRVMEFYLSPPARAHLDRCFDALLRASGATAIEAQTNMPLLDGVLRRFATKLRAENILFGEPAGGGEDRSDLSGSDVRLRRRQPKDEGPSGEWVLVRDGDGVVVASGGSLQHYNPPYCDLFMEVASEHRRRGYGSYLVQELRRVTREAGLRPAARCDIGNEASRRTLIRGGLVECGRILAGQLHRDARIR